MNKMQSPPERAIRCHRVLRLFILLPVGLMVAVAVERWRGQWALSSWKSEMAAKGEIFEAQRLWPPASEAGVEFSNGLARAIATMRVSLADYAGQLSGFIMEEPGRYRRGSQEPRPPRPRNDNPTNTWQALDELIRQNQASLQSLCELMKDPPPTMGRDIARSLEDDSIPNLVAVRAGAQMLHVAVMNDLHKGDLEKSVQDLGTLLAFAKLYEQDPSLVNYMIRVAIIGLSVDACWDALQADGWTEPQLATLQQACLDTGCILLQLPRTMEAERAGRIYGWQWFRSHSYQSWVNRHRELYQSFGMGQLVPETAPPLRQWCFHPLWSFAWADQEELEYLRQTQLELTILREAARQRSWLQLNKQMAAHHQGYHPPTAAWRFYMQLPLVDRIPEIFSGDKVSRPAYPYPFFSRAFSATIQNLTQHELVITALALKRYALRHGQPAVHLGVLVPDFLYTVPTDFMDGQPLRYRMKPDGAFVLYSVGANLKDDGGDFDSESTKNHWEETSPWSGRDWVWPHSGTSVKDSQVSSLGLQSRRE